MIDIDFVVAWVDGGDPVWQEKKNKYWSEYYPERSMPKIARDNTSSRYRDWGIFHYWFRSVEQNAPWVRKVYLVTDRQIPNFLTQSHPKLSIVFHDQYIPEEYLPTFNSRVIETNFHRIPGLSEFFVYFNDDAFLNRQMKPEDFFRNGKPCYSFIERPIEPRCPVDSIQSAVLNDMGVINRHFTRKDILYHPNLYLNYRYGKHGLKNLLMLPWPHYQHFADDHMPCPFLKSTLIDVWEKASDILDNTCRSRFRERDNVNQFLFKYWDLARGNFAPIYREPGYYLLQENNINSCVRDIVEGIHPMVCVNDGDMTDIEMLSFRIQAAFQERYPQPCSFER